VPGYALRIPIDTNIVLGDTAEVRVDFGQLRFTWFNGTEDRFPEVVIPLGHNHVRAFEYDWQKSEELTTLNHFLSLIAAKASQPISIHKWHRYIVFEDGEWEQLPRNPPLFIIPSEKIPREPESNEKLKLALSLYREAVSSSSVFYSFLSYYKILELGHDQVSRNNRAGEIRKYIDTSIHQSVKDYQVSIETRHFQSDIPSGETVYSAFRCAIAHASEGETRSPDNMADYNTVRLALDYIRALAMFMVNSGHFEPRD
jgi:hypothetical protein